MWFKKQTKAMFPKKYLNLCNYFLKPTKMSIGTKLKKIREQKRFSQREIADRLGISQKTYSNIESDKSNITIDKLAELSKILEFDAIDLLKENDIIFHQKNEKESFNGIIHHHAYPKELIEQYKAQIQQLKEMVQLLKEQLEFYKNQM